MGKMDFEEKNSNVMAITIINGRMINYNND